MNSDQLIEALRTNRRNLARPIESLQKKSIKQSQRAAAKKEQSNTAAAGHEAGEATDVPIDPIADECDGWQIDDYCE